MIAGMKLEELAERLGAVLTGGDPAAEVTGVTGIEEAGAGQVTFVANPKYASLARTTGAAAVIVEPGFPETHVPTLRVENPYLAFAKAVSIFYQGPLYAPGVHPTASVSASARVGERAHIGAYAVIGDNVVVGEDAVILPHVVLYPGVRIGCRFFAHAHAVVREFCTLGDDVVLQNGAIVGSDGFGFAKNGEGRWVKIVQSGPVIVGNDVEVQANSTIDRASVGETRIDAGAKIDNLVQVGHGSAIGENTLLCAQVGLAGSSIVGRNVILTGQVGVAGHMTVGDGAIITAQSGVGHDVAPGAVISGSPGMENKLWRRVMISLPRLPELMRRVRDLERKVNGE